MIAATDWTVVLTAGVTAVATAAAALGGSYVTTRGQARVVQEERESDRVAAQAARRQSDLMEVQNMLAALVTNVARDASPHRPAGSVYILERVKMRQQLLAVLGRVGDGRLNQMVEALFLVSDRALGEETPLDDVELPDGSDPMDLGVGEIVRRIHHRVGELLRQE